MEKQKNIPKSFIGFLIVSFLIWMLINLSKQSVTTVSYEIEYYGLSQDKILQENPVDEIKLLVKGTGYKLFATNFSDKKIKLSVNKLRKKSVNDFYFLTENQKNSIQKQLISGLLLEDVLQDTIYLKLGSLQSKKVPVLPNLAVKYKLGYDVAEKVLIIPDSILISGPELQLKEINAIQLPELTLQNVSKNVTEKLPITLPVSLNKVKMSHNNVLVKIMVDKFTEGEFEVPVSVKNISAKQKLNIFPKKVKVVFKIGLNDFDKVTADSFEVVCDFDETVKNGHQYLIPKLKNKPNYVSSVRIVPNKIDFLIYK